MGVGLGADGIPLRTKLRREPRDGHARRAVLLLIVVFGGSILKAALRLAHRAKSKSDQQHFAKPTSVQRLRRHGRVGT